MSNLNAASRFDEIYHATNRAVRAYITAKCGRVADAGDIFQETYLELYRLLVKRGADYITNEKALTLRLAKQKIARHYSLMERLKMFISLSATHDNGDEVDISDFDAHGFLTEDIAVDKVMVDSTRQLLQSKPQAVQKIFVFIYDMGFTLAETAQALSLTESNVKNKLYRTLKELRKILT